MAESKKQDSVDAPREVSKLSQGAMQEALVVDDSIAHVTVSVSSRQSRPLEATVINGKITDSIRVVTSDDGTILFREGLGKQWKKLAKTLKLGKGDIDAIDYDYNKDGLQEKIVQMVLRFQKRNGKQATANALAQALCDIERADLALEIPD